MRYEIPAARMEALCERLDKMVAKGERLAHRLGLSWMPLSYKVEDGEPLVRKAMVDGFEYVTLYRAIDIVGEAPKASGWSFIATIDHAESGNLIWAVPGEVAEGELEPWRHGVAKCDHCRTNRPRKDTFIVRGEGPVYKEVGRSCLADFLPGIDPDALAQYFSVLTLARQAVAECEAMEGGFQAPAAYLTPQSFLSIVAALTRRLGYVSRSKAEAGGGAATASLVEEVLEDNAKHGCHGDKALCAWTGSRGQQCGWNKVGGHVAVLDQDRELARAALAWVLGLELVGLNDYMHNLRGAVERKAVTPRLQGVLASLIPTYQRAVRAAVEKDELSKTGTAWVGMVDARMVLDELEVIEQRPIEGYYGVAMLHVMRDKEGHLFEWFAHSADWPVGTVNTVRATIKSHKYFRGQAITVLSRAIAL